MLCNKYFKKKFPSSISHFNIKKENAITYINLIHLILSPVENLQFVKTFLS